jgi:hypothetical protein
MPAIDLSILNQRQTPAFYADVFANRPAAGFVGRIFVSTNTFAFYRDNGTGWDLIGGPGTGTITGSGAAGQVSFWNGASTITGENNLWWDSANNHLGINTNTPATALDVNHNGTLVAKFNNTTSANSLIAFENAGNEQWWIGTENTNNDFLFYDATNFPTLSLRTTFKTNGQVLIGGGSTGSGKLVVESATSDNGIQIVGASAPSLRIDSAATGPTKRIGLGISTAVNNFIQGSVDRDMCIFNGSTTASPMLFGIYDTTNVQEAARISAARNFLIGTTTDGGQKLQVNGGARTTGYYLAGMTAGNGALYWSSDRVTLANYNVGGSVLIEVNGGNTALTIQSNLDAIFEGDLGIGVIPSAGGLSSYKLFEIASGGASIYSGPNQNLNGTNISWSGGTASYKISNFATLYNQQSGQHQWSIAPSGTSGNTITFSTPMTLTSSGNLLIGTATDNGQKLQIAGNFSSSGVFGQTIAKSGTGIEDINFMNIRLSGTNAIGDSQNINFLNNAFNTVSRISNIMGEDNVAYGSLSFSTRNFFSDTLQEVMRLSNKGYVLIGTSTNGASKLRVVGLPTSSAGLSSGDVYSNLGILTIVP